MSHGASWAVFILSQIFTKRQAPACHLVKILVDSLCNVCMFIDLLFIAKQKSPAGIPRDFFIPG